MPLWSTKRIKRLIELYKQHECLWNNCHKSYNCNMERNRAIETICVKLRISKFEFGRKISNLRNQFTMAMKRLEQRAEKAGELGETTVLRCKWTHFNSLMFLSDVLGTRMGQNYPTAPKKMLLKIYSHNTENDDNVCSKSSRTEQTENLTHYELYLENVDDNLAKDEYQHFQVLDDQKNRPLPSPHTKTYPCQTISKISLSQIENNPSSSGNETNTPAMEKIRPRGNLKISKKNSIHKTDVLTNENSSSIKINVGSASASPSTPKISKVSASSSSPSTPKISDSTKSMPNNVLRVNNSTAINKNCYSVKVSSVPDQWDAFGQLVATEFHNLNSDISRKKLKRKIMQAMLEVGEEDYVL